MKCVFGFTPNPECGNCGGTGIFSEPDEPCVFCVEDGIVNGEVDGCFQQTGTLAELLPPQPQYCLMLNGDRYARFGQDAVSEEVSGLLVFANVDQVGQFTLTNPSRAEQFVLMNGVGLSEFQPLKVAAEDLLPILMAHGGKMCVPFRLGEMVATVSGLDHLHRHCAALSPGPVADVPTLDRLLAALASTATSYVQAGAGRLRAGLDRGSEAEAGRDAQSDESGVPEGPSASPST